MIATKLTLSAEPRIIAEAKRLALAKNTSVSALFSRFVESLSQAEKAQPRKLGQLTRRAAGLVRLHADASDKDLVADALSGKYRL